MDLALNNLQMLMCHKTKTTNHPYIYIYILKKKKKKKKKWNPKDPNTNEKSLQNLFFLCLMTYQLSGII